MGITNKCLRYGRFEEIRTVDKNFPLKWIIGLADK